MAPVKKSSINNVIRQYSRKPNRAKLTVRKLDRDNVLIEGTDDSLKFLAHLLIALAHEEDCGFQLSPKGAGMAWFAKDATLGVYLHRIPCTSPPQGSGTYTRPPKGKRT